MRLFVKVEESPEEQWKRFEAEKARLDRERGRQEMAVALDVAG